MTAALPPLPPHLAAALAAAIARYTAGRHLAAAILFTSILEHVPDYSACLRLRGLALVRAGRPTAALSDLRRARALAPGDPLSHLHYGIGLQETGCHARAAALFRRAAILWPDNPAPWINLGSALLSLGHVPAARAAARRAMAVAPAQDAQPIYMLGLAELAAGDLPVAQGAFAEAIKRQPGFAPAWVNLVLVLVRTGQVAFAIKALERGRLACPRDSALAAAAAGFDVLAGDQDGALNRLRAIIARDPACVAARLNLANAVLVDGEAQEALTILSGAAPRGRDGAHWRAHRALALLKLGRDPAAAAELDAIAPPYGDAEILILWRRINLALRAGQRDQALALADRMAALADDERASLYEHRIIAHFELARFRYSCSDLARAFGHWSAGHALLARLQPFSRTDHAAFLAACKAVYSAAALRDGPVAANTDDAPVFIVGLPRSGTSLTEQILAAHPMVHGGGERPALHNLIARISRNPISPAAVHATAQLDAATLTQHADAYLAAWHAEAGPARRMTDKMPANALHLGFIARLFPKARIIICERDLRDVGLSIFQLRFFGYHPYAHDLTHLGWYMAAHARLIDHWRGALPIPVTTVALSDWVDDFAGTLDRVLRFLDLPPDPACALFHQQGRRIRTASARQVRQPINSRGIGRWRGFAAELAPMIAELDSPAPEPAG